MAATTSQLIQQMVDFNRKMNGERRRLTTKEEIRLAKAMALRNQADALHSQAYALEEQADAIEPKNLYPDSVMARLMKDVALPAINGNKMAIPKFSGLTAYSLPKGT